MNLTRARGAFIMALRGIIPKDTSLDYIKAFSNNITDDEYKKLTLWENTASYLNSAPWNSASPSSVAKALSIINKHHFPMPVSVLGTKSKELIMSYYSLLNMKIMPIDVKLNDDQIKVLESKSNKLIINAGPGTGKTTTAVELIHHLFKNNKKILIVTYTHAAGRVIKEMMAMHPVLYENTCQYGSETNKNIILATVDKLTRSIFAQGTNTYGTGIDAPSNFDTIVKYSLGMIQDDPDSLKPMYINGRKRMFDYIIIDEGQTFDDNRLNFIIRLSEKMKTGIYIFCDPKQTISSVKTTLLDNIFDKWDRINLKYTYRFGKNMLNHVMQLSENFGKYHVKMKGINDNEAQYPVLAYSIDNMEVLVKKIINYKQKNLTIGILAPSIGKTNKSSKLVDAFVLALQCKGISCGIFNDTNFKSNSVIISTFHSSAGFEYDIVVIIGASGYPSNMPVDVSGKSLIFIANSRARYQIIYMYDKPILCEGINLKDVKVYESDIKLNTYTIPYKYDPKIPTFWTVEKLFGDNPNTLGGLYIQTNMNITKYINLSRKYGKYTSIYDITKYFGKHLSIMQGGLLNPANGIFNGEATQGFGIMTELNVDNDNMRDSFYIARNMRVEKKTDNTSFIETADQLKLRKNWKSVKPKTKRLPRADAHVAYCPDFVCNDEVICITPNVYGALFTATLYDASILWHINPVNRTINKIIINEILASKYIFHIAALISITSYDLRISCWEKINSSSKCNDGYAADTEFQSTANSREIYDIAFINIKNPYLSIVGCANTNIPDEKYINQNIDKNSCEDHLDIECRIDDTLPVYYFHEASDYKWMHTSPKKVINVVPLAQKFMNSRGIYLSNSNTFTLKSFYGEAIGPCNENLLHKAVNDACFLAECIRRMNFL